MKLRTFKICKYSVLDKMADAVRKRTKGTNKNKKETRKDVLTPPHDNIVLTKVTTAKENLHVQKDVNKRGNFCILCVFSIFVCILALFLFVFFTDYGREESAEEDLLARRFSNIHQKDELIENYEASHSPNEYPETTVTFHDGAYEQEYFDHGDYSDVDDNEMISDQSDFEDDVLHTTPSSMMKDEYYGDVFQQEESDADENDIDHSEEFVAGNRNLVYEPEGSDFEEELDEPSFSENDDEDGVDDDFVDDEQKPQGYRNANITSAEDMLFRDDLDNADDDFNYGVHYR